MSNANGSVGPQAEVEKRAKAEIERIDEIPGLALIRPKAFPDERGFFSESYNISEWAEQLDFHEVFKQDNHSFSKYGVLRGLHSQPGMGKLVSVLAGKIFDVAVDIRDPSSPTYGKWKGVVLDSKSKTNYWIPSGFLHGFQCLSPEGAHVVYKCTGVYNPTSEFGVNPLDEDIGVEWPIADKTKMIISARDQGNPAFAELTKGLRSACESEKQKGE